MATEGFIQGTGGEEISVLVDNVKLMAVQNFSWRATQAKSVIRGSGHAKPHGMGRGPKEYEFDFEVKELNNAVISEGLNTARSSETKIEKFKIGEVEFTDLLDLRDMTILIIYPVKNNAQRIIRFLGCEFTDNDGGFDVGDEAVGRKISGIALDASGLV